MSCRLIGFATLTFLSAYSFKEAAQLGYFSRRSSSTPRVRGAMLVVFGIASGVGGVYRLIN